MTVGQWVAAILLAMLATHWLTAGHDDITCVTVYVNGVVAEEKCS